MFGLVWIWGCPYAGVGGEKVVHAYAGSADSTSSVASANVFFTRLCLLDGVAGATSGAARGARQYERTPKTVPERRAVSWRWPLAHKNTPAPCDTRRPCSVFRLAR